MMSIWPELLLLYSSLEFKSRRVHAVAMTTVWSGHEKSIKPSGDVCELYFIVCHKFFINHSYVLLTDHCICLTNCRESVQVLQTNRSNRRQRTRLFNFSVHFKGSWVYGMATTIHIVSVTFVIHSIQCGFIDQIRTSFISKKVS